MTNRVAGHEFDLLGRCTRAPTGDVGGVCPITWRQIADADDSDLHKPGVAHYGNLTPEELNSIRVKKTAERAAFDRAMNNVSGRSYYE